MKRFATLLERLVFTTSRNGKIRLLQDYFRSAPDPDRGLGLAAIAGTLEIAHVTPAVIRHLLEAEHQPSRLLLMMQLMIGYETLVYFVIRVAKIEAGQVIMFLDLNIGLP